MSIPTPPNGYSPDELDDWANIVSSLAFQIRDEDPRKTWRYINRLNMVQLRVLAFVAISGFDADKTLHQAFAWTKKLVRPVRTQRGSLIKPSLSFLEQYQELHNEMGLPDWQVAQRMGLGVDAYARQCARYGLPYDDTVHQTDRHTA